jgi:MFS family permease
MTRRTAARIGWSLAAFAAAIPVLILAVAVPADEELKGDVLVIVFVALMALVSVVVGALVVSRQPANAVGWLFSLSGALVAVTLPPSLFFELAPERGTTGPMQVAAWTTSWAWILGVVLVIFVPLLFPDGALPSAQWRWLAWCGALAVGIYGAGAALEPGPLADYPEITNPVAVGDTAALVLERVGFVLAAAAFVAAVASVVYRYRRSDDVARQQIKCLAAAAAFLAFTVVVGVTATVLGARSLGNGIMVVGFASLPIAVAIAMRRYRLYDVDRLISRSLTYALVTGVLVAAYAGLVLVGQAVFSSFAGGSNLAIAVSTLVVAALFLPLRSRVQRLVDRRFNRRRYDAQRTLDAFGSRLREQVELEGLRVDLEGVVRETMQPAHVSLWRREGAAR